jgi:hypothetical protein
MAGRQLKDVVRAFRNQDELSFRRAILEIAEEEEARHHFAIARDLRSLLAAGGGNVANQALFDLPDSPKSRDGEWDLVETRLPALEFDDLVLDPSVLKVLEGMGFEAARWDQLAAAGVPRRQKLLLTGPAGTGKTSAAEALASSLGWPLSIVSVDTVVSSYLGETAANIRRVFEFAQQSRVVMVFDEFDALGRMRDDSSEHGEMKRVVSSFLQFLERYDGPGFVVAISNYPGLLDFALWRRFDEVVEFSLPNVLAIRRLLRLRSSSMISKPFSIEPVASALRGLPHAAVEKFVLDIRRQQALGIPVTPETVGQNLREIRARPW